MIVVLTDKLLMPMFTSYGCKQLCTELWQTQGSCCTFASLALHQKILTTENCVRYSGVAILNSKKAKPQRCSAKMWNQRRTWLPPGWLWGMADCSDLS